jgi:hypothetical protein
MKYFFWFAFVLFMLTAVPCALYFGAYLANGDDRMRAQALRFYRWSALVVLITFNVTIFRHIILIIIHW